MYGSQWDHRLSKHAFMAGDLARYREIKLEPWREEFPNRLLFDAALDRSQQIPRMFFTEFFIGSLYLRAGYEVLRAYRPGEVTEAHLLARRLMGPAADFIMPKNERDRGRPPDLIVLEPSSGRFRFVECKARSEALTRAERQFFPAIEEALRDAGLDRSRVLENDDRPDLFPRLRTGEWIHIAVAAPAPESPPSGSGI